VPIDTGTAKHAALVDLVDEVDHYSTAPKELSPPLLKEMPDDNESLTVPTH
jgi:hypothetical protein